MAKNILNKVLVFGLLLTTVTVINGNLNVYLNLEEVIRLLGVSAELYYVREGQLNNYALNFVVPVPSNMTEIAFTWQSLADHPLPYSINIETSDPDALPRPTLNITRIGEIPVEKQTFAIGMKCSGSREAEVEIKISVEIVVDKATNNVTELVFKRKKFCLVGKVDEQPDVTSEDPLQKENLIPQNGGLVTLVIGGILAFVLVGTLIIVAYCARGPTKRPTHAGHLIKTSSFQRLQTLSSTNQSSIYVSPSTLGGPTYATLTRPILHDYEQHPEELHRRISELTVQKCRIRLYNLVQEGTYGRVYRGTYNDTQNVLVKTVAQHANQTQVSLLLQEGMNLYGASHQGILSVLGVSIEDHTTPFVLYPSINNTRNLKLFLLEPGCARSITTIQMVLMSSQIATAIGHLHSHGVLHKDIASRNCVIDDNLQIKLCDSSLSRDLFPGDYNCLGDKENRPVKWLSLEALQRKQFTESSDTWAFGVLMWELCTFAKMPYAEVDPFEMEHYLRDGYRLAQPFNCPDELFRIMAYCWALMPTERPSFGHLQICLQDFYTQITRYV